MPSRRRASQPADANRGRNWRDERGLHRASTQPVQTNPDRALRQLRQCGFSCDCAHAARDPTASAALVHIGDAGHGSPRDSMAALSPRPRSARKRSPLGMAGYLGFAARRAVLGDWRNHPVSGHPGTRSALSHHRDGRHVCRRHGDQCVAFAVTPGLRPADRPANGFALLRARIDHRQRARSDDRCVRGGAVAGRTAFQSKSSQRRSDCASNWTRPIFG